MKSKKDVKKIKEVLIVKQETVEVKGESKIKYTLSDGSVQYKGL